MSRVSKPAAPGSLLKSERPPRIVRPKRDERPNYLALIRQCPCLACHRDPAGEAAHLRMTVQGKPITGTGMRPDDRWALPLCHVCHMTQHQVGEGAFWARTELNPVKLAKHLFELAPNLKAMRTYCLVAPTWQEIK